MATNGLDDLIDCDAGIDLERGSSSQHRFCCFPEPKFPREFVRMLSIGVGCPRGQPLEDQ
jgi:hypothetical protein